MMPVLISNRQKGVTIDSLNIKKIANAILNYVDLSEKELSISFVEEKESIKLNKKYRGKDYAAEVLSFPLNEENMIGDIVITPSISKERAQENNVSFESRIAYVLSHGILHLKGFTHKDEDKAFKMEGLEDKILDKLNAEGLI